MYQPHPGGLMRKHWWPKRTTTAGVGKLPKNEELWCFQVTIIWQKLGYCLLYCSEKWRFESVFCQEFYLSPWEWFKWNKRKFSYLLARLGQGLI